MSFSQSLSLEFYFLLLPCTVTHFFSLSFDLFQCRSFSHVLSVTHSCLTGIHTAPVLLSLCLSHTLSHYYIAFSHHSASCSFSCSVWHWAIGILQCKATNGRLQMLSTNTPHTPAPNLFISVKICVHTVRMCIKEYVIRGSEDNNTISW